VGTASITVREEVVEVGGAGDKAGMQTSGVQTANGEDDKAVVLVGDTAVVVADVVVDVIDGVVEGGGEDQGKDAAPSEMRQESVVELNLDVESSDLSDSEDEDYKHKV
jgi:hypothetical protein